MKLAVTGLLCWAIYRQVFAREDVDQLWASFRGHFVFPNAGWLLAVMVLAPLNLALEAQKWQVLTRNFSPMGFGRAFQAVLAGTTLAIFTPNRVGEYAGRALYVGQGQGWKAVVATVVGGFGQLTALIPVGMVGAAWFSWRFLSPDPVLFPVLLCLGAGLAGLLLFTYFNIEVAAKMARRISLAQRFKKQLQHLAVLRHYRRGELARALLFALLRYLTYTLQYYILLRFYGIETPLVAGLAGIATIYLVQASVPLPPLMGLLARGEIALYIWGFFSKNQVDILAATFSLFVINLVVPALLGLACIVQMNVLKSMGYENETAP